MRPTPLRQRFALKQLAMTAAVMALSLGGARHVHAQDPGTAASASIPFSIAAQPLGQALNELARQADVQMTFPVALVAGKAAPAVIGRLTVQQALDRLLAGSGLIATSHGSSVVVTQAPSPQGGVQSLSAVLVTAEADLSGTTEGSGSFTTRSMSSATHLPLSMRETPQSVTVLTSARIAADNLVDLVDIAKATPGLSVNSTEIRPIIQSRGYEVESVTQDGLALQYNWYAGDTLGNLAMQDRVEVVRGATGLMQGGGNPSAAINMIRKRPTTVWQLKGAASVGSWDDYRLTADVSGPLTDDGRVRGRLVAYGQDAKDYYDLGFNKKYLAYATVDVDLTSRTTLNIGYSHTYSNRNLSWGGMPTDDRFRHLRLPRSTFVGADWEYNKTQADTLYLSLAHDFGDGWKANLNGTYVDGSYGLLATFLEPTRDVGGYGHAWWAKRVARTQTALDLFVAGPVSWLGRQHDLAFGATVNRQNGRVSEWGQEGLLTSGIDLATWNHAAQRPDTSDTSPWLSQARTYYRQESLYSAGRFRVSDSLDLLLGARLDWYDRRGRLWSDTATFTENAHLTKYAGLTWKFADQHSAYLSYTDVFQPQEARDVSGNLLPPKVGKNYEIGIKGEYLKGALNSSLAFFTIDERNRAVYMADQGTCPFFPAESCASPAGLVRTQGVDLELQGALTKSWQIGAGITWSETRYRQDANPANVGKRLSTAIPTTLVKLSTQYSLSGALSRLTLGTRVSWQSKMFGDAENAYGETVRNQQGAVAIVDLSARYNLTKNLNLKLDVNNVFDKVYYTSIAAYGWYWSAYEAYGRPRSVLLTLSANY